jgi:cellulase/cellobiase CelA1
VDCIVLRVFADGRIERTEHASNWRNQQELTRLGVFLQPTLAALHVAAGIWRDLEPGETSGEEPRYPSKQ